MTVPPHIGPRAATGVGRLGRDAVMRRVARATPRVPDRLLAPALRLSSTLVGRAPSLLPPVAARVLVLVPHPDDEAIGAGGLLALLARRGARIDAVLATDGEATIGARLPRHEIARRRRDEFSRSMALIAGPEATSTALALPDGDLPAHRAELAAAISAVLARTQPDLVLSPWPLERHPDHRAVTAGLLDALAAGVVDGTDVWTYEAHTPIPTPSHVIDVTDVLHVKTAALDAHVTAGEAFDLRACLGLATWRSLATRAGRGAAEGFLALDAMGLRDALMLVDGAVAE